MKHNRMSKIAAVMFLWSLAALAGNSSGTGGFAFRNSRRLLADSIVRAVEDVAHFDEACVNRHFAKSGVNTLSLSKLSSIIKSTRSNITGERERVNPATGEKEPLVFDYGTDGQGPYIEALKIFFVGMMGYAPQEMDPDSGDSTRVFVARLLVHEASHHFGYDENLAEQLAEFLVYPENITPGTPGLPGHPVDPDSCWHD